MKEVKAFKLSDGRLFESDDYETALEEQKKIDYEAAIKNLIESNGGYFDEQQTLETFFKNMKEPLSDIFKQFT